MMNWLKHVQCGVLLTLTRASVKLVQAAISSLVAMSGYLLR